MTPAIDEHRAGCSSSPRVENYTTTTTRTQLTADGPRAVEAVAAISRCIDCGAHAREWLVQPPRVEPGTTQWRWAWQHHPHLLVEQLTPAELHDPTLNPLHPQAWHPRTTDRFLGEPR